jgi:SAM-dependent methyltransferase
MPTHYIQSLPDDRELAARLALKEYPRSAAYNPRWVLENQMGPNVLWLAEALARNMDLTPGMRVLDLGCGKALSSIFLAREFGVQVWAADLWIDASENWLRISQTEVSERVFPLNAEARALPFADGFFDAMVSLDAYQYFGTDDLYFDYFNRFVKPGGQIGIVVPGLQEEFTDGLPASLQPYWEADYYCWHSPAWWQRHWQRSGKAEALAADWLPDGGAQWLLWTEVCRDAGAIPEPFRKVVPQIIEMLRQDAGRHLGFTRMVARKR